MLFILLLAAASAEPCPPFRELRPVKIARDRSVWWLSRSVDPEWFKCARKAGGKLTVRSEMERDGAWDLDSQESSPGSDLHHGAWASNYCGRIGKKNPSRIRFVVAGEGALAPLSFTSETRPALCGCTVYPSVDLRATPSAAGFSVHATITPEHVSCLREEGSSLEVRAYSGRTAQEALAKTKPAWSMSGLEAKPDLSATIPKKSLCAGGATEAVLELAGRGTFGELTGNGETQLHLDCR
jgi:hypothetical protein